MSKFFSLTKKQTFKVKRKKMFKLGFVNIKVVNVGLGCLVGVFALSYLVQINGLATKGYQIKELEQQVTDLQLTNSDLELQAVNLQSMGRIRDEVAGLNMVAIGETDYLNLTPVAVAR